MKYIRGGVFSARYQVLMRRNRLLKAAVMSLVTVSILVFGLNGCAGAQPPATASGASPDTGEARIIVTRNFGRDLMVDELIKLGNDTSAMEALGQVAEIETTYGGGFVDAIDGVSSRDGGSNSARADWFVYLNGIQSDVGALDYTLYPGDVEHWDFRDWRFHHFVPAIIGDFPEPFLHGYEGDVRPVLVVYQDNFNKEAEILADHLLQLGVEDVAITEFAQLDDEDRKSGNIILLGDMNYEPVEELNDIWKRLGFYACFEVGKLQVFDCKGEPAAEFAAGSGLIQATQNPWNPDGIGACENVVWMVSGVDAQGVKSAVEALVNHYSEIKYACAAVIAEGEIHKIPAVGASN